MEVFKAFVKLMLTRAVFQAFYIEGSHLGFCERERTPGFVLMR